MIVCKFLALLQTFLNKIKYSRNHSRYFVKTPDAIIFTTPNMDLILEFVYVKQDR